MIADIIARLRQEATGDERDGVWEEGYSDALHDVAIAVTAWSKDLPLIEDEDGAPYPEAVQAAVADLLDCTPSRRCPRCDSPSPGLHPAMQFEGEVQVCPNPWHGGSE